MKDLNEMLLGAREALADMIDSLNLPIVCYDNFNGERIDGRTYENMTEVINRYPGLEITSVEYNDTEVMVYC